MGFNLNLLLQVQNKAEKFENIQGIFYDLHLAHTHTYTEKHMHTYTRLYFYLHEDSHWHKTPQPLTSILLQNMLVSAYKKKKIKKMYLVTVEQYISL